jgi:hypothetical protein
MRWWMVLAMLVLTVEMVDKVEARRRKPGGTCGLSCYRWRKCRGVLATLTSTTSGDRPGERGTTGQLIFKKCTEPAASCNCQLIEEPPKPTEPPKPKFPKKYIEFVDEEAMDWLTNLVDID